MRVSKNLKRLEGFPGYKIHRSGVVFSDARNKFLKNSLTDDGYVIIRLRKKKLRINRLVAIYFVPNPDPENKKEVNHIDGDKLNNNDWNLEWHTRKENAAHAKETGLYNWKAKREAA